MIARLHPEAVIVGDAGLREKLFVLKDSQPGPAARGSWAGSFLRFPFHPFGSFAKIPYPWAWGKTSLDQDLLSALIASPWTGYLVHAPHRR